MYRSLLALVPSVACRSAFDFRQRRSRFALQWTVLTVALLGAWISTQAQSAAPAGAILGAAPALITQPVDETSRTVLRGNTHPLARAEFDRGAAPDSLALHRMELVLNRSADQDQALRTLLDQQQDRSSSNYRQWLTPETFGRQFGLADSDLAAVRAWLEAHGFQVISVSKGKTAIEFSGTAGRVREAFHTSIHKYVVNGAEHWANSSDPSIPAALAPAVKGVLSLHNFPRQMHWTLKGAPQQATQNAPLPLFTYKGNQQYLYGVGPTDLATIYNLLPLWSAGIDGTGQTIAIVGETNIHLSDIETFRSIFGLPAKDPQIILNGPDPGVVGDEPEAVLDVSWSGAVAKNATIDLVVSQSTETSLGVDLSALYIVDNNLAPVMSESYGECESVLGNSGNAFYNSLWQQAAAQGITVVVAAGDGGSAGCDDFDEVAEASGGLAVSGFASTPYNVAVGGTDFDQTASTAPNYWNATNDPTTGASAKGYIPETTWNDSCAALGAGNCPTSSAELNIVAGSGGPSSCSTQGSDGTCQSGTAKPAWQTGAGVPQDGVRDLPDVSLFASNGQDGSFYIMCEADMGIFGSVLPCSLANNSFVGIGGTSASAPVFAGMMALVNQKTAQSLGGRQGNANYILYKLAAQQGASCNSSSAASTGNSCIFYDVTKGNDSVPCSPGTPNCGTAPTNGYGVLIDPNNPANPAWTATSGYDLATGLGSLNANNLVNAWNSAAFTASTTTLTSLTPVSLSHGQAVNVAVTVSAQGGTGTPTGSVALMATPAGKTEGIESFSLNNGVASGATTLLPGGTYNVTAHYAGDGTFGSSDSAPVQVTVGKENSRTKLSLIWDNMDVGLYQQATTVPFGALFLLRGDVTNASGASCAPSPAQSEVGCPSGTVSFTKAGTALDAGSYFLNTQGYVEDQLLAPGFTSLGTYTLQAQYAGDSSYNPSNASLTATVTQAPTKTEPLVYDLPFDNLNPGGYQAYSGQAFRIIVPVYTESILQAPTGTISILENGSPAPGTIVYGPRNGSFSSGYIAYLAATLNSSIDTPGTYTVTASYGGDTYYLPSQGDYAIPITVVDTTFNIASPVPNVTIPAPGQSGTTTVSLAGVDYFAGQVTLTCTLPAAMTEATCPTVTVSLPPPGIVPKTATATATLTITTTAAHQEAANRMPGLGGYGAVAMAGIFFLFGMSGVRRRKLPWVLLLLVCVAGFAGCGGGGVYTTVTPPMDPGTPAGTYTVNVSAASMGITRTSTFTVTVE